MLFLILPLHGHGYCTWFSFTLLRSLFYCSVITQWRPLYQFDKDYVKFQLEC
jgi:hypothetical protein